MSGRLLIATAVEPERRALLSGLAGAAVPVNGSMLGVGPGFVDVAVVGVGPAAAAAATARLLTLAEAQSRPYRAVLCAGIGGGFTGRIGLGDLALATGSVTPDLGAESPEGFIPIETLGFGTSLVAADPDLLDELESVLADPVIGTILTVSTVTGTSDSTAALVQRHPDAVAEGMEGFGVATAASQAGLAFAELRAISNLVGPRDRDGWRMPAAMSALTGAGASVAKLAW